MRSRLVYRYLFVPLMYGVLGSILALSGPNRASGPLDDPIPCNPQTLLEQQDSCEKECDDSSLCVCECEVIAGPSSSTPDCPGTCEIATTISWICEGPPHCCRSQVTSHDSALPCTAQQGGLTIISVPCPYDESKLCAAKLRCGKCVLR